MATHQAGKIFVGVGGWNFAPALEAERRVYFGNSARGFAVRRERLSYSWPCCFSDFLAS
jgi:hypothetical protein